MTRKSIIVFLLLLALAVGFAVAANPGRQTDGGTYATVWEKGKDGKWRAVVTIASGG